jgi:hypothetical protein
VWEHQPIGVPIPVFAHLFPSVDDALPPTDQSYRYVLLSAGESGSGGYNDGVLVNEAVSGSFPLVIATAVIDYSGSPLDGQTVNLVNTEGRSLVAGDVAGVVRMDQAQGWQLGAAKDNVGARDTFGYASDRDYNLTKAAATSYNVLRFHIAAQGLDTMLKAMDDGTNGIPRKGLDTHGKDISAVYVMRIM